MIKFKSVDTVCKGALVLISFSSGIKFSFFLKNEKTRHKILTFELDRKIYRVTYLSSHRALYKELINKRTGAYLSEIKSPNSMYSIPPNARIEAIYEIKRI